MAKANKKKNPLNSFTNGKGREHAICHLWVLLAPAYVSKYPTANSQGALIYYGHNKLKDHGAKRLLLIALEKRPEMVFARLYDKNVSTEKPVQTIQGLHSKFNAKPNQVKTENNEEQND